jgi:cysteinyl-tRNA synthetase
MMVLNGSYRAPLSYSDDIMDAAERGLDRLRSGLKAAPENAPGAAAEALAALDQQTETTQQTFIEAMDDDFNSSGGLAALFELVRAVNTARSAGASQAQLKPAQDTLRTLTGVLGLRLEEKKAAGGDADAFIALLVEVRSEARKQKNWALGDLIRDRLKELGVMIEDSKDGTSWHWA